MERQNVDPFLEYFSTVRERTMNVVKSTPPDKLEWTYKPGKFTIGDFARHIAITERDIFAENVQLRPSRYQGCGRELADGFENVLKFMDKMHAESMDIFAALTPEDLEKKAMTPGGFPVTVWKLLRAMAEHEIHHRGEIYVYLGMLGVTVPPLFGLTSAQVIERSVAKAV